MKIQNQTRKRFNFFVCVIISFALSFSLFGTCIGGTHKSETDFSFVFFTDVHLHHEQDAVKGLNKAINKINELKPDFVITGGDLIMDALEQPFKKAVELYDLYINTSKALKMPVYNGIGNHEFFGLYEKHGITKDHLEYGKKMFNRRIGKNYYSFDYKGWHFMVLDSICPTKEKKYRGFIDDKQMEWIKSDLAKLKKETPIVISTHIPFITSMTQLYGGSMEANKKNIVTNNSKEVLEVFDEYNLKLVLQGHLHFLEAIYANGIYFITGSSISGKWWEGPYKKSEEGFIQINVKGNCFNWKFIDYEWDAKPPVKEEQK
jgi:Icc protein